MVDTVESQVDITEAAVEGWGSRRLAALDFKHQEHSGLKCLCPDCYIQGYKVGVHYVAESSRRMTFLSLNAQTHEVTHQGVVERVYRAPPHFATNPNQTHVCDIPKRQALKRLAYHTNALRTSVQGIYAFNMRVPYGDNYFGRSFEFLDGRFAKNRMQVQYGAERTKPDQSGLRTADDLVKFFTDVAYSPELMRQQKFWDGQRVRKAGDFLVEDMQQVVEVSYDPQLPLPPVGFMFRPIRDHRVRAAFARSFLRDDSAPWLIPGLAGRATHRGAALMPSVVLEFTSKALRSEASKIVNRAKKSVKDNPATLVVGQFEANKDRFDTVARHVREGRERSDGLKQAFPIYLRVHDIAQVARWEEPDAQSDMFDQLIQG